jgi:nucleoid-associated protein EbfC
MYGLPILLTFRGKTFLKTAPWLFSGNQNNQPLTDKSYTFAGINSKQNLCDMFDMMKMMGKMKEVQQKMKEAQDNLSKIKTTSESGGGMVRATVNGKKQVLTIDIDPSIIKADDKILMQDLVVAAVNKAMEDVDILAKEEIKKATDGLLPNIPGMDLSNLMG